MEKHPLNPMTDSNIRRWLMLQSGAPVGLINLATVRSGSLAIEAALAASSERLFIADATTEEDLISLGLALNDHVLITGASGIALGLPENFRRRRLLVDDVSLFSGAAGPCAILAGSCSSATLGQVALYARHAPSLQVRASELLSGEDILTKCIEFAVRNRDQAPLVYSSDQPSEIAKSQSAYGTAILAAKIEDFFGALADGLMKVGFSRLVVAGGETSGAVVTALKIKSFTVGPEIVPGVPCLSATGDARLALALKSGNFGGPDFFEKAVKMQAGQTS